MVSDFQGFQLCVYIKFRGLGGCSGVWFCFGILVWFGVKVCYKEFADFRGCLYGWALEAGGLAGVRVKAFSLLFGLWSCEGVLETLLITYLILDLVVLIGVIWNL